MLLWSMIVELATDTIAFAQLPGLLGKLANLSSNYAAIMELPI